MIDRYEIIRPLGQGGMGQVLLARDTHLGRLVALKLLTRGGRGRAARFWVEARATAQVRHDNIVVIYELGEHDGAPYMVLEYLRGKTLRQWLDERRPRYPAKEGAEGLEPLPPGRAVEIMIPVVRALVCAHEQGIVHRDLKPSNILLTDTGSVKVLDFGLAKLLDGAEGARAFEEAGAAAAEPKEGIVHTADGALLGTLPYMSPEQLLSLPVDHRADVWAVGILLAELVLGRHPLAPLSMLTLANIGVLDLPMPSLRELRPDLGRLAGTIDRCLIKRAEDRLGSARELYDELSAVVPSHRSIAADERDNPYAGLSAFQESDAGRFFGRARAITEVTTRLADQPLIAVVGPSGVGKSSFVRAGVIPALRRSGEAWEAFVLRPGPHPLAALAELLIGSGLSSTSDDPGAPGQPASIRDRDALLHRLRAEPGLLGAELRARARRRLEHILVFVDQFEEVYTLATAEERAAFFACLAGVADDAGSPLRAVIAVRSDFLDRVTEAHAAMIDLGRALMLLPPIDRGGLREALVRPLEAAEYRFEPPSLVEEMLDTLEHTPGALPLLQFTAEKLWEQRDRGLRALTEESYRRIGGVEGTLAGHADAVLAVMSSEEQRLARAALLRLVTPERTRALSTRRELCELSAAPEPMDRVLARLIDARLLSVESGGAGATVELVHESLITRWPTLSRWVADNQEDAAFLARLKNAAREWEASGDAEDVLFHGRVADEARRFRARYHGELAQIERRFLEASLALADRSQRQRRLAFAGVVALSVLVAAGMSYLAWQEREANQAAEREAARAQAEAREARNASRMATARELQSDPTTELALLREVEPPVMPRGWSDLARRALHNVIALGVLTHEDTVTSAAFSPDGERIVTASHDKTARVWSADGTGEPLILRGHEHTIAWAVWSPDGRRVVTASYDKTARVWPADSTGEPLILRGHEDRVYTAVFSPDGERIVTASDDRTARVWSADGTGEPLILRGHEDRVSSASFSPDGERVVTSSYDKTARIWSADGEGEPLVLRGHEDWVSSASFSPDGARVVTSSYDKTARVWSADGTGEPLVLRGHEAALNWASWSLDGERIATAADDKTTRVWRADGEGEPLVLRGHQDWVSSAVFSPDRRRIVTASADRTARVWSTEETGEPLVLRDPACGMHRAAWSPDGERVAVACDDKTAWVWSADGTGAPVILRGHEDAVSSLSWSPEGGRVVTASNDKTARVWSADGRGEPLVLRGHEGRLRSAAFSPDGERVVTTSEDRTARVWGAFGVGELLVLRGHEDWVVWASWSPDGERIVTASTDKTARVWSAEGAGELLVLRGHEAALYWAAWSPDGKRIVTTSDDETARVWSADEAGELVALRGHEARVIAAAWSPDGTRIVTTSADRTARVWSADGAGEPLILRGHEGTIYTAAWSPDGERVLTAGTDRTARLWGDLTSLKSPDEPRLWTATTYCLSIARRVELLNISEAAARADQQACRRRVESARAAAAGPR